MFVSPNKSLFSRMLHENIAYSCLLHVNNFYFYHTFPTLPFPWEEMGMKYFHGNKENYLLKYS